jgi:hypothetical protein
MFKLFSAEEVVSNSGGPKFHFILQNNQKLELRFKRFSLSRFAGMG